MKRVLLGTKRKKAGPARKPVAKRPARRAKAKPAQTPPKVVAKKAAKTRKAKPKVARAKLVKTKPAQRKVARLKPITSKVPKTKRATRVARKPVVAPNSTVANATTPVPVPLVAPQASVRSRQTTARKSSPQSAVAFAIESDEELAVPATILPETPKAARWPQRKKTGKARPGLAPTPPSAVPAFLLEGDETPHPEAGGPGEKFALGPTPPLDHFDEAKAPLPESYGTGKIFLTARDPHWLYAHWDLTREEQFRHNARSVDRHLVLRVHAAKSPDAHIAEHHVHPESKHWFVHVDRAGESYMTELGYYQPGQKWKSLACSAPQRTPPGNISADATVKFATIPPELSFETMLTLLRETSGAEVAQNTPLALVVDQIRPRAREHFPKPAGPEAWTVEQETALAGVIAAARAGAALPSSDALATPAEDISWPEFNFNFEPGESAPLPQPSSHVSSFFGGETPKDFWFHINAELIVYGATEPNATVTFAGKPITLRPDGSFRFRFALPDGTYELPATAVSADGTDGRAAELKFSRATEIRGHVAAAPVDPALKAPPGESA
jgi:hypothetical protein